MNPSRSPQEVDRVVDRVGDMLQSRIGLRPDPSLRGRLRRCIRDEAALRDQELESYLKELSASDGTMQALLNLITVQETGFFRHPEHFEVLARDVLPNLPQPIRIWSAGCANGQEAFSLAMVLDELRIDGSVIATDLSTTALQRTAAARYPARELTGLSADRIARHLVPGGGTWGINRSLRDRVTTVRHNLMDPPPDQVRGCRVVFCRNVLIYFSPEHTRAILDRVADTLPEAWLFLGSAETMWTVSDRYRTIRIGDTYTYRLRNAAPARPARPARPAVQEPSPIAPIAASPARSPRPPVGAPLAGSVPSEDDSAVTVSARTGQQALADGDHRSAVVHFRRWAYLACDDALAHLHLGLALEAAGDQLSAQRAFGAARRALQDADPAQVEHAIGGYAPAELLRLLDTKQQVLTP